MTVIEQLKQLSPERFASIYKSLEVQGFGPLDREVAAQLRFRLEGVRKLPIDTRAKRAKSLLESTKNAEITYELFGAYLIKNHKELVTGFLDQTGVAHQDGMVEDPKKDVPDAARVAAAVEYLDTKFAPEDVTLYVSICTVTWPESPEFEKLWRARTAQT